LKSAVGKVRAGEVPTTKHEASARLAGAERPAGVDEAGRGPLAGPVVAAAVILPDGFVLQGLRDSKLLSPRNRTRLFGRIMECALGVGVGICSHLFIDRVNILRATREAMKLAVLQLTVPADHLLIDGPITLDMDIPQTPIIGGDRLCLSIAAASVVAKVTRDRIMDELHVMYPTYGFDGNKGYPTRSHKDALARHGPCPVHRMTFSGVCDGEFFGPLQPVPDSG
jgi:ribonuclease HII